MARVSRYAPPVALMALIFALSSLSDLNSGLNAGDFVLRKLVHMTEFGVLFGLWLRATGRAPLSALIAIAYAATDEWHQSFVDGRHGTPVDVLIDATGVLVAALVLRPRASRARSR